MNLNKEICKKCIDEFCDRQGSESWRWNGTDDRRWDRGFINCCLGMTFEHGKLESIPSDCFYQLEHIMIENKK